MKDSEFKALIQLLEDDDPQVSNHVEQKLMEMGGEMIPRLEQAWEVEIDEIIQQRLEDIIHGIQEVDTIDKIINWRDSEEKDLLEGWFLLSKYLFPNLKLSTYKSRISRLTNRIWLEFRRDMTQAEKLMVINSMLFRVEKFRPGGRQMNRPAEFLLHLLFEKRRGGPYSLGVLYKIICDKLEIPLEAIILPGYFVLRSEDEGKEFFIDVFQKGDFFAKEDISNFLQEMKVEEEETQIFKTVDPLRIIQEMIKGLMNAYQQQKHPNRAKSLAKLYSLLEEA